MSPLPSLFEYIHCDVIVHVSASMINSQTTILRYFYHTHHTHTHHIQFILQIPLVMYVHYTATPRPLIAPRQQNHCKYISNYKNILARQGATSWTRRQNNWQTKINQRTRGFFVANRVLRVRQPHCIEHVFVCLCRVR